MGQALLRPAVTRRVIEHFLTHRPPADPAEALTPRTEREREVLLDIAPRAVQRRDRRARYLSDASVKTHASRVLAKFDLRDRSQAAVWAYEHGVVIPGQT